MAAASKPADFELKLRMFGGSMADIHENDTPGGDHPAVAAPSGAGAAPGVAAGLDFIQR